jgi:hypothetical protein
MEVVGAVPRLRAAISVEFRRGDRSRPLLLDRPSNTLCRTPDVHEVSDRAPWAAVIMRAASGQVKKDVCASQRGMRYSSSDQRQLKVAAAYGEVDARGVGGAGGSPATILPTSTIETIVV